MTPVFEDDGYWYFWDRNGQYSEPYDTELDAYAAFRIYYKE